MTEDVVGQTEEPIMVVRSTEHGSKASKDVEAALFTAGVALIRSVEYREVEIDD